MKITSEQRVHVLDSHTNSLSIINDIVNSGFQEEAFYICDIGDIVRKHKLWKIAMPRIDPYYAVKCNDNLTVLETLAALGIGFDCASKGEMNKVLSLGVSPDRIIYANPVKPLSHLRHAYSSGVDTITFDNESELHKIKKIYPEAKLIIRIRCDDADAQCQLGMKFGCDYLTEAPSLLTTAKDLGLNVIGVSFHVGSGCQNPHIFQTAIQYADEVFKMATTFGYDFKILDIGGGFPGVSNKSIEDIAEVVNAALQRYFPDPEVQVIAEPGRFYVASAFTLACNIYSIRKIESKNAETGSITPHNMYYINDGVYGSFNCILYDHQQVVPIPLKEYNDKNLVSTSVWGPTCDGLDQITNLAYLPEMKIGEWLIFENMGAYTITAASQFNGFPVPKVHVIADEGVWALLKNLLPLTEDHFVIGSNPANLKIGLDLCRPDTTWSVNPISLQLPVCHETHIGNHVFEYVNIFE